MKPTPESEKVSAIKWFAQQPRSVQLEAIKLQTDLLRQGRGKGIKTTPETVLDQLAEASRKMRYEEESLRLKAKLSQDEAKKVHDRRVTRFKASRKNGKPSPKRESIRLKFFHLVQDLRSKENFGWRNCASYLREYHKFNVTHAYLKEVVEDLERLEHADKVS